MKTKIFMSFFLLTSLVMTAQQKIITWAYGLNGSNQSWESTADAVLNGQSGAGVPQFSAYPFYCKWNYSYGTQFSLSSGGDGLYTEIASYNPVNRFPDRSKDFIIAHSQGGLVARWAAVRSINNSVNYPPMFGGIVTFGTSHGGARILNNIDPSGANMLNPFLSNGCSALAAGPAKESIAVEVINFFMDGADIQDRACGFLADVALNVYLSGFNAPITNEYQVGASEINDLNTYTLPGIEKVAFYGKMTNGNEVWRLASSELFNQENSTNDAFVNNDDEEVLRIVSNSVIRHAMKESTYNSKYRKLRRTPAFLIGTNVGGLIGMPGLGGVSAAVYKAITLNRYLDIRNGYSEGKHWLLGANTQWKTIIGSRVYNPSTIAYMCECEDLMDPTAPLINSYPVVNPSDCAIGRQDIDGVKVMCSLSSSVRPGYYSSKFSDAVVLEESAKAFPGVPVTHQVELTDVNHQMLRNSMATRDALERLFDDGDFGTFFQP